MHKTRLTVLTAFVATFAMLLSGLSLADDVVNNIDTTVDQQREELAVPVGGIATTKISVINRNTNDGDPGNNCNLSGNSTFVKLNVVSSATGIATVSPSQITIEDCDDNAGGANSKTVTVTGVANGMADITFTVAEAVSSNSGTFAIDTANFKAKVGTGVSAPVVTDPCASVSTPAPPVVSFDPASPNGLDGWYTTVPTVSASSTTADATIDYSTDGGAPYSATAPILGQGTTTVTARATSATCNKTSTGTATARVDTVAPTVSAAQSNTTWSNAASVTSGTFTASDATSGIPAADESFTLTATAESTKVSGAVVPTTVTRTITDAAGNSSEASFSALIDRTKPTNVAFVGSPADGSTHWTTSTLDPTCTADDALSGLAGCNVTGFSTAVGTHTLTATATDNAGNTETAVRSYTVRDLTHTGFYSPVVMTSGVYNTVKGGSTVPLKFNLQIDGVQQSDTTLVKGFSTAKIQCDGSHLEDPVDIVTTGSTALRYDATGSQFIQNWKTPTTAACYRVTLTTVDNDQLTAWFRIK